MSRNKMISRFSWLITAACILELSVGCTHQIVLQSQAEPLLLDQKAKHSPVVVVLKVEDGTTGPDYQQDPKFVGQDVSHWALIAVLPTRHDTNRYSTDVPRTEVAQESLTNGLTKMGLMAVSRSEAGIEQLRNLPDGQLVVKAKLRSFEVTNSNELIIILLMNVGHIKALHAQVAFDSQVLIPGEPAPVWQGTVTGQAEWKLGQYGDVDITENLEWRDRGIVIRLAIENAVGNLVTQANLRQLSARLQENAQGRFIQRVQEKEKAGDLQGALSLYGQAYRSAMSAEGTELAIAGIARVWQKMPGKPALPEEARRYGVQATSQADKKRYEEAIKLYEKALDIAPWWAEGHFNRALVLADQNRYAEAIASMKHFVILSPNSSEARAAQDKLYEWELEAQSQPASSKGSSSTQTPSPQSRSVFDAATKGSGQGRSAAGAVK